MLVQEKANTSVSSAHGIVTHDTSITKATLALYLWHLWVQDMNFFLLMQDAREVQVTEGYLGPLGMNLMKPYSKSRLTDEKVIFNYRLSRARRVSENAFGILAARFRVLHTVMCLDPRKARNVVLACCTLHNMLLSKSSQSYCPSGSIDYEDENGKVIPGSSRRDIGNTGNFISLPKCKERHPKNADDMRDILCDYVNGPGAVPCSGKCLLLSLITACAGFLLVRCCEDLVIITFKKSHTSIGHTAIYNSEHFSKYK